MLNIQFSSKPQRLAYQAYLFFALATVIAMIGERLYVLIWNHAYLMNGEPDSWLRLTMIEQLYRSHDWYNHVITRLTPPLGTFSPWTHPLDVLMLILTAPFIPFMGIHQALLYSACFFSPILFFCSFLLNGRIYARLDGKIGGYPILLLIFFNSPLIVPYFNANDVDHHSLLATLSLWAQWIAMRPDGEKESRRMVKIGLILGLGIWVSVEFLIPAALMFAWWSAQWVYRRRSAGELAAAGLAMTLVLIAGVLLERLPRDWGKVEYDTISILDVALGLLITAGFMLLSRFEQRLSSVGARLIAGTFSVILAGGLLIAVFPQILTGPFAAVDPYMKENFLSLISEMQPLWKHGIARAAVLGGMTAYGAFHAWRRLRRMEAEDAWALGLQLLFGVTFCALVMLHRRFIYYAAPTTALLFALAMPETLARLRLKDWLRNPLAFLLGMLPLAAEYADKKISYPGYGVVMPNDLTCDAELMDAMDQGTLVDDDTPPEEVVIYAPRDYATNLLFFTPYNVLAGNYHRDALGYRAHYDFALATDDKAAHKLLADRGVTLLAACHGWDRQGYFKRLFDEHQKLPAWLHPHEEQNGQNDSLALFDVDP